MSTKLAGPEIERLIQLLARLPGLGHRSARKAALTLVKKRNELLEPLAQAMAEAAERVAVCPNCGNFDTIKPCTICQDPRRDASLIVVVEEVGNLWTLEQAGFTNGYYHVLGGYLSPLDGLGPDKLNIARLLERAKPPVKEVILYLSATVEGQSTVHYLRELLAGRGIEVSTPARGIPVGGELDYLDEGTLAAAFKSRKPI
jgi:recombination protein RecR